VSAVRVLREGEPVPIVDGAGTAEAIVGPHIGARHRTMCRVALEPGSATVALRHRGEAVWYVVDGVGEALPEDGVDEPLALEAGAMVHAGPGTGYRLRASVDSALRLVGGPSPPDPSFFAGGRSDAEAKQGAGLRLFHRDRPSKLVPMISSDARLVVWPGVGAETANMNYVRLQPGEQNQAHSHAESEDTIAILSGRGSIDDLTNGTTLEFEAGDVIHVPPGLEHRVKADRGSAIESVGGPCPPDRAMLRTADPA
jgi:quercetin dioxygenase-like cupin family protein